MSKTIKDEIMAEVFAKLDADPEFPTRTLVRLRELYQAKRLNSREAILQALMVCEGSGEDQAGEH